MFNALSALSDTVHRKALTHTHTHTQTHTTVDMYL